MLIEVADSLHDTSTIDGALHERLSAEFSTAELLDAYLLCGWYHAISFAANAAAVDLEPGAPVFADYASE